MGCVPSNKRKEGEIIATFSDEMLTPNTKINCFTSCCAPKYVSCQVFLHPKDVSYFIHDKFQAKISFYEQNFEVIVKDEDEDSPTKCSIKFLPTGIIFYPTTVDQCVKWGDGIKNNVELVLSKPGAVVHRYSEKTREIAQKLLSSPTAQKAVATVVTIGLGGGVIAAAATPVVVAIGQKEVKRLMQ